MFEIGKKQQPANITTKTIDLDHILMHVLRALVSRLGGMNEEYIIMIVRSVRRLFIKRLLNTKQDTLLMLSAVEASFHCLLMSSKVSASFTTQSKEFILTLFI